MVFRKRIRLFGQLYLNASLHHIGLGVHVPGASFSINDSGRRQASIGVPGSGLRVQQIWSGKTVSVPDVNKNPPSARLIMWPILTIFILIGVLLVIDSFLPIPTR